MYDRLFEISNIGLLVILTNIRIVQVSLFVKFSRLSYSIDYNEILHICCPVYHFYTEGMRRSGTMMFERKLVF